MTTEDFIIETDCYGFPDVGHGGYTAGLIAEQLPHGHALEAKFVSPPPLGAPLTLDVGDDASATLRNQDQVIVEVRPTTVSTELPTPPSLDEASAASANYVGLTSHPASMCMTCGPDRDAETGLRVFAGSVEGRELVACEWTPNPTFADAQGVLLPRFVWASLDCPSYWAIQAIHPDMGRIVTARLSLHLHKPVPVATPLIVMAWPLAKRGTRLFRSGAAILTPDAEPLAVAEATWINADG